MKDKQIRYIGEHIPTPLASSDPPPSPLQSSLLWPDAFDSTHHLLHPPCLTPADSILYLLGPFCLMDDPLFSPSVHSPPYGLSIQPNLPTLRHRSEATAFRTRNSISLCCLYYWTSLAPRPYKKKIHVSLLIMPRLNFTSLHYRPATPHHVHLNSANLNLINLNSANLNSINF